MQLDINENNYKQLGYEIFYEPNNDNPVYYKPDMYEVKTDFINDFPYLHFKSDYKGKPELPINATSCYSMFEVYNGKTLDLSDWDTSNITNMSYMFACSKLTILDLGNFDTSKVENMDGMFLKCLFLTSLDLNNFNTSNVTDMYGMFSACTNLTNLDVSNFDTSKVTDMRWMFEACHALTDLDIRSFDTSKIVNFSYMFNNCSSLKRLNFKDTQQYLNFPADIPNNIKITYSDNSNKQIKHKQNPKEKE